MLLRPRTTTTRTGGTCNMTTPDVYAAASQYAEFKRDRIQRSVVDQQLVDLVQEAWLAGYSAHMQDIAWGRDKRYERISERVDL